MFGGGREVAVKEFAYVVLDGTVEGLPLSLEKVHLLSGIIEMCY